MTKQHGLIAAAVMAALTSTGVAAEPVVTVSGLVEIEASSVDDKVAGTKSSDIILATAEVAVDAEINKSLSAHFGLLYEEDDAAFDGATFGLDEATMTLKLAGNSAFTAGRMFVPFGSFETNMVSDPLTLELGETSESAFMLSVEDRGTTGSLYVFNGDADESSATDNSDFSYGANISFGSGPVSLGLSYISNITDTDKLQENSGDAAYVLDSAVAGTGINLALKMNRATFIAEYMAADAFAVGDLIADSNGDGTLDGLDALTSEQSPTASHYELAFSSGKATIALAYQQTDEAQFLGLPESVNTVAMGFDLVEGASLGIEYAEAEDYSVADGGSGETTTSYTMQLAVEF